MSFWGIIQGFSLVLGVIGIAVAVFLAVYNHFDSWKVRVNEGVRGYVDEIYITLEQMYIHREVAWCYRLVLGLSAGLGVLGLLIGLRMGLIQGIILSGVFGMAGYKAPGFITKKMFEYRLEKFNKQLVDALNLMSNAIKSGLSFMQVVQVIEKELPNPCAEEFRMVLKENRLGVNLNDALLNMTKRVPSEDLFMIINSVVTLSQQGGDLSEAFETIAFTIRERQRVSDKIKTMAQAGITQGFFLSALPFALLGLMYTVQREYVLLLFSTTIGNIMMGVMVTLIILGALWMKKLLTIDV